MTNFNGINPWINMLNCLNAARQNQSDTQNQNIQNTNNMSVNPNLPNLDKISTNIFSNTPTNYLINQQVFQDKQVNMQEVLKMNNEVAQKYLQSLLEMPETIDKFLNQINRGVENLQNGNLQEYKFLKLFVENMLNNSELSKMLSQNSSDAIQKLLNVITQSLHHNGSDLSQLKEIMSALNTIHTTASFNTNTIRELFLLYIPISYQVYNQNSDFSKINSENSDSIKESALSILFETRSFSNILAILNEDSGIVSVEIKASEDFPFERFKSIITAVLKENSTSAIFDFVKIKEYGTKGEKQNFKVITSEYVPINVLNIAYMIVKTLFKLDNDIIAAET